MDESTRAPRRRTLPGFAWLLAGPMIGGFLMTAWQARAAGSGYDPQLDVNHDGAVNTLDIQSTAGAWNTTGDPTLVNLVTRGYYQTSSTFAGNAALTACAAGYHMASMAELYNTSAMRYAKEVAGAATAQDSGNGPPFSILAWVRTGVSSNTSTQVGAGNCALWSSNSAGHNGTTVGLNPQWLNAAINLSPWDGLSATCNTSKRVWCAQD